eukprot:g4046.t1
MTPFIFVRGQGRLGFLVLLLLGALVAPLRAGHVGAGRGPASALPDPREQLTDAATPYERKERVILSLPVQQLREECRKVGLRVGGNKGVLQSRLKEFYRSRSVDSGGARALAVRRLLRKSKADLQRQCEIGGVRTEQGWTKKDMAERLVRLAAQVEEAPSSSAAAARFRVGKKSPRDALYRRRERPGPAGTRPTAPKRNETEEEKKEEEQKEEVTRHWLRLRKKGPRKALYRRDCPVCLGSHATDKFWKVCVNGACRGQVCNECMPNLRGAAARGAAFNGCPVCRSPLSDEVADPSTLLPRMRELVTQLLWELPAPQHYRHVSAQDEIAFLMEVSRRMRWSSRRNWINAYDPTSRRFYSERHAREHAEDGLDALYKWERHIFR